MVNLYNYVTSNINNCELNMLSLNAAYILYINFEHGAGYTESLLQEQNLVTA